MKIRIELEVPPEELRRLLGLPDLTELQGELLKGLQGKMQAGVENLDPVALLKSWMPLGVLSPSEWHHWVQRALERLDADVEIDDEPSR